MNLNSMKQINLASESSKEQLDQWILEINKNILAKALESGVVSHKSTLADVFKIERFAKDVLCTFFKETANSTDPDAVFKQWLDADTYNLD